MVLDFHLRDAAFLLDRHAPRSVLSRVRQHGVEASATLGLRGAHDRVGNVLHTLILRRAGGLVGLLLGVEGSHGISLLGGRAFARGALVVG